MIEKLDPRDRLRIALNRLAKWRVVFAGWQLGTRTKDDPEGAAVRDHREQSLISRVELTALTGLLVDKGVFTAAELQERISDEAHEMERMLEHRFPGFKATDTGMDINLEKARETMKGWRP